MNFKAIDFLLAEAGTGAAQAGAAASGASDRNPKADQLSFVLMLAVMGFLMYFIIIRPQNKRAKEHEAMLKTLKAGDKIVTNGGMIGVVVAIKERAVTMRSGDTKVEILKSAISQVDRTEEKAVSAS
jgi:preprotein translocase subunit YajC